MCAAGILQSNSRSQNEIEILRRDRGRLARMSVITIFLRNYFLRSWHGLWYGFSEVFIVVLLKAEKLKSVGTSCISIENISF